MCIKSAELGAGSGTGSPVVLQENADGTRSWVTVSGAGGASEAFKTIAVSGQSNVVADSATDTLTLVAGSNVTITTDASTDTITINSTASGSGSDPSIEPFLTVPANPGWDPLFTGYAGTITLSNSNKTATPASSQPYNHMFGTPARYTGKYYFELVPGSTSFSAVGVCGSAGHFKHLDGGQLGTTYTVYGQIGWENTGGVKTVPNAPGSILTIASIQTWTTNSVCCFALDLDAALIWFRTDGGNWNNNGSNNPATGTGGIDLSYAWSSSSTRLVWPAANAGNTSAFTLRLLSADFTQSAPSGFSPWGGS